MGLQRVRRFAAARGRRDSLSFEGFHVQGVSGRNCVRSSHGWTKRWWIKSELCTTRLMHGRVGMRLDCSRSDTDAENACMIRKPVAIVEYGTAPLKRERGGGEAAIAMHNQNKHRCSQTEKKKRRARIALSPVSFQNACALSFPRKEGKQGRKKPTT